MPAKTKERPQAVEVIEVPTVDAEVEIVLDQTPGKKYFQPGSVLPPVIITKKIRVNREAITGSVGAEKMFIVEINHPKDGMKTVYLSELEILGNSKMVQGRNTGCGCNGARFAHMETTAPVIGKDHKGEPFGIQ